MNPVVANASYSTDVMIAIGINDIVKFILFMNNSHISEIKLKKPTFVILY